MDHDALTSMVRSRATASWRLAPNYAAQTQGLVVSGFGHLPAAEALCLHQVSPGTSWLRAVQPIAPVTDATGRVSRAVALAFTAAGLAQLGLDEAALASFDSAFRDGMHAPARSKALGDAAKGAVVAGGLRWSGAGAAPIHALLLLYGPNPSAVESWADEVLAAAGPQIVCPHRLRLNLHIDQRGIGYEHFGFADGISQPIPYGAAIVDKAGKAQPRDPWHGIASGDVLLGHIDADEEPAASPYVPATEWAFAAGLEQGTAPPGFADLGLNGSYLVARELLQDVPAFWDSMERCAASIRERDPAAQIDADWIAARVVGRDRNGHLLSRGGVMAPEPDGLPQNATGFFDADRQGLGCPLGSHVRRANPRDGLADEQNFQQAVLAAVNKHRLLRRGRKYGPRLSPGQPDQAERGMLFMCLNTNLARQFEFVQQNWLLNRSFADLRDQTDPLLGPRGQFTLQHDPLRRLVVVDRFVQLTGGEYFFLPSLPALKFLLGLGRCRT